MCILWVMCSCQSHEQVPIIWKEVSPLPEAMVSAAACSDQQYAYVFAGRDTNSTPTHRLWQYDPIQDAWIEIATPDMKNRVKPTIIAYQDALYMGLGFNKYVYRDSSYLTDWWKYDLLTKEWTRLPDFPSRNTIAAVSYVQNKRIYLVYPSGVCYSRDVYYYDLLLNSWTMLPDQPNRAPDGLGMAGAQSEGRCFIGTGFNTHNLNSWYEVDLMSDTWSRRCSMPGKGRSLAATTATSEYVYVFGGRFFAGERTGGEVMNSAMRYTTQKDTWEWLSPMPFRAENQIAFTLQQYVYVGLGEDDQQHPLSCMYRLE